MLLFSQLFLPNICKPFEKFTKQFQPIICRPFCQGRCLDNCFYQISVTILLLKPLFLSVNRLTDSTGYLSIV